MATKNIVPRADSEGGIGTTLKRWASGWFDAINGKDISSGVATTAELEALTPPPSPGGEPGVVSSSTSGAAGSAATFSRSDHNHDLGEHTHRDAATGGALGKVDYHGVETGFTSISMVGDVLTIGAAANKYWYQGVPFSTTNAITCDLSSTAARDGSDTSKQTNRLYFIYFKDSTGTLYWSQQQWSLTTKVPVATAYYNGSAWAVGRETHSYSRNLAWHENAHKTIGARYESGLDKTLPTSGTPATLTITSGTIYDEDIAVSIAQQTTARAWYQASSGVYTFTDISLPYTGSSGAPTFLDTDTYALATLGTNKFSCYWVYASNDVSRPIYIIPSHISDGYSTISLARAETPPALAGLGLSPEIKLLYRWIYKSDGSFQESADYRTVSSLPSGFTASTTASSVSFTPTGNVASTTVQAAIEELDSEKIPATTGAATSYVSAATESAAGIVELATTAEAQAGTDTSRAVTAAGAKAAIQKYVDPALWLGAGIPPTSVLPTFQWRPGREDMPSIVTATRASTATRVNEIGLIEQVAANVMREDFDPVTGECLGLLIEEQRTNLFLNSSTPATQNFTVTAQAYSLSFYGAGSIVLSGAHSATVVGNSNGTRKTYTFTPTAGTLAATVSGTITYPQLEVGAFQTSYVPTTSAATTRSADILTVSTSAFAFNPNEGTFFVAASRITSVANYTRFFEAYDGTGNNAITAVVDPGGALYASVYANATQYYEWNPFGSYAGASTKIAQAYKINDLGFAKDGVAKATDTTAAVMPSNLSNIKIGADSVNGCNLNGHIRHIAYFPRRLSNSQLQLLTA